MQKDTQEKTCHALTWPGLLHLWVSITDGCGHTWWEICPAQSHPTVTSWCTAYTSTSLTKIGKNKISAAVKLPLTKVSATGRMSHVCRIFIQWAWWIILCAKHKNIKKYYDCPELSLVQFLIASGNFDFKDQFTFFQVYLHTRHAHMSIEKRISFCNCFSCSYWS